MRKKQKPKQKHKKTTTKAITTLKKNASQAPRVDVDGSKGEEVLGRPPSLETKTLRPGRMALFESCDIYLHLSFCAGLLRSDAACRKWIVLGRVRESVSVPSYARSGFSRQEGLEPSGAASVAPMKAFGLRAKGVIFLGSLPPP